MAGWFRLIPKPGNSCNKPQALRPICLQHPLCNVASSFAARSIMQYSVPQLIKFLLYAYLPHRGTTDCLLRVSEHCRIVRDRCIAHAKDDVPHGLFGGSSNLIRHGKSLWLESSSYCLPSFGSPCTPGIPAWFCTITFDPPISTTSRTRPC